MYKHGWQEKLHQFVSAALPAGACWSNYVDAMERPA